MVQKIKGAEVRIEGVSDLTIAGRKFSGNSQYRKRTHALVHGTFLLTFDLSLIERCLLMPKRQPEYRHNRSHGDFIANIQLDSMTLRHGLIDAWNATEPLCILAIDDHRRTRGRALWPTCVDGKILTRFWGPGLGMKTLQIHLLKIEKNLEKIGGGGRSRTVDAADMSRVL